VSSRVSRPTGRRPDTERQHRYAAADHNSTGRIVKSNVGEASGGRPRACTSSRGKEAHATAQERQQHTYERHEGPEPVRESCHRQAGPLKEGLLPLAIIPARKSLVQRGFVPSSVRAAGGRPAYDVEIQ
jgi:hypothetical protein